MQQRNHRESSSDQLDVKKQTMRLPTIVQRGLTILVRIRPLKRNMTLMRSLTDILLIKKTKMVEVMTGLVQKPKKSAKYFRKTG